MPTESQYRSAASDFRMRAASYHDTAAWAPPRPAAQFTGDGPVATAIDDEFAGVLRLVAEVGGTLDSVAAECERRADVCRRYHQALQRYHSLPSELREITPRPLRPAWWVN